jgi:hypothetical protein
MGLGLINFPNGAAGFASSFRGVDDRGHYAFELRLASYPSLYGEYRPKWAENGNDYDVEIVSFGFASPNNLGNPSAGARLRFSSQQRKITEGLIVALVSNPEARKGTAPFTSKKSHFRGHIHFLPGWIIEDGQ